MADKKQYVIIILLIVLLITTFSQSRTLKKELNNTNYKVQTLQNEINRQYSDIRHNIPKQIQEILVDKENRVTEYKFIVKSIDANKGEADLSVDFAIKNIKGDSDVFILYRDKDSNDWNEVQTKNTGMLNYSQDINLSLKSNYSFKFVEKSKDGSISDLNTRLIDKDLYTEFYENRTRISSSGGGESKEELDFNFALENNTFGLNEFEIKTIIYRIYYKETLIYDNDITSLNMGNQEDIERYNLQVASGEIEPNKEMKPSGEVATGNGKDSNIEKMYFNIKLSKAELIAEHPGLFEFKDGFLVNSRDNGDSNTLETEIIVEYNSGETTTIR